MSRWFARAALAVWISGSIATGAEAPSEHVRQARSALEQEDLVAARRHLEAAVRTGPGEARAEALLKLAALAREDGDFGREAERLRDGVEAAESLPPGRRRDGLLARALVSLGVNEREAGRNEEALALYDRALDLAESADDPPTRIDALGKRSVALLRAGNYDRALIDAQRARSLALDGGSAMSRASTVFALAQVHAHLWDLERAAELWTQALDAYREVSSELGVGLTARQRMDTWFALGDLDRAAQDGETALSLLASSSSGYLPGVWARLAHIQTLLGESGSAREAEAEALRLSPGSNHAAYVWNELGLTALTRGDFGEAESRFSRSLELAEAGGDREYRWRSLDGLGRVALARGDPPLAERYFREAVVWIDQLRRELPHPSQRATLVSGRMAPYERLVLSVHAQSRAPDDERAREALELADASRARTLSEILEESGNAGLDAELESLRAAEEGLGKRISVVQQAILSSSAAERSSLVQELEQLELDYEALSVRIKRRDPAFQDLANPAPFALSGIAAVLDADEALVSFLVADEAGVGWILTRERLFSYAIPGREALDARVSLLLGLTRGGEDARGPARELGRVLFDPALDALERTPRLVVVGSGPLQRLPFALVEMEGDRKLVERFSISSVPSARLLAELRRRAREPTDAVLAVASNRAIELDAGFAELYGPNVGPGVAAPLVEAQEEAEDAANALAPLAPTVLGVEASSETRLKELDLGRYRVLHFAAHAAMDEAIPRRSALLLGADTLNDGLLQLNEIGRLPLEADLVVVSSCSSYLGQALRGEGFVSLSRGFLQAGARAVVASLWPVSDRETRRLMQLFYRSLATGLTPDRALRRAQMEMMERGGESALPRSWAGFVLTGDVSASLVPPSVPRRAPERGRVVAALVAFALALLLALWRRAFRRG